MEIDVVSSESSCASSEGDVVHDDGLASANNDGLASAKDVTWLKVGMFCSSLCVDSRCIPLVRSSWRV